MPPLTNCKHHSTIMIIKTVSRQKQPSPHGRNYPLWTSTAEDFPASRPLPKLLLTPASMGLYSTWPVTSSRRRVYQLLFCGCDRIPRPKATSGRESLFWHMATTASSRNGGGSRTLRGQILHSKQEAERANWEQREPGKSLNLCPVTRFVQQDCTSPVSLTGTQTYGGPSHSNHHSRKIHIYSRQHGYQAILLLSSIFSVEGLCSGDFTFVPLSFVLCFFFFNL